MVPDEVLLAIFDFCAGEDSILIEPVQRERTETWWQILVHVCRRWRTVVFGSPRRLNLRLFCTSGTLTDALDVWRPALPLLISVPECPTRRIKDIIALLEHSDRVCQINLRQIPSPRLFGIFWEAMQKPFPELTDLVLSSLHETMPVLPNSFLGGSAPRLRILSLRRILFPDLLKLLLSATHLVGLYLWDIPHSEYISSEAMATVLSTLTSLESLHLQFRSPGSLSDQAIRHPPSPTRSSLPVLTEMSFRGVSEYLEHLVARINAPQLRKLDIAFFSQIRFDTLQLIRFISSTPKLKELENACVVFGDGHATVTLSSQTSDHREFAVRIFCEEPNQQVSSLVQILTSSSPPLSILEDFYIYKDEDSRQDWQDNLEIVAWLELLHPFKAVKNLYLSEQFIGCIGHALRKPVGGRTTEILPALENFFWRGSTHSTHCILSRRKALESSFLRGRSPVTL